MDCATAESRAVALSACGWSNCGVAPVSGLFPEAHAPVSTRTPSVEPNRLRRIRLSPQGVSCIQLSIHRSTRKSQFQLPSTHTRSTVRLALRNFAPLLGYALVSPTLRPRPAD